MWSYQQQVCFGMLKSATCCCVCVRHRATSWHTQRGRSAHRWPILPYFTSGWLIHRGDIYPPVVCLDLSISSVPGGTSQARVASPPAVRTGQAWLWVTSSSTPYGSVLRQAASALSQECVRGRVMGGESIGVLKVREKSSRSVVVSDSF